VSEGVGVVGGEGAMRAGDVPRIIHLRLLDQMNVACQWKSVGDFTLFTMGISTQLANVIHQNMHLEIGSHLEGKS